MGQSCRGWLLEHVMRMSPLLLYGVLPSSSIIIITVLLLVVLVCCGGCYIWWQRWDTRSRTHSTSPPERLESFRVAYPAFSGTNIPANEWLQRVEAVKLANGWGEETAIRMLATSLTGPALMAYHSLSTAGDFCTSVTALANCFRSSDTMQDFLRVQLDASESVLEYYYRLQICLDNANCPMPPASREKLLREKFINGLPGFVKRSVECQDTDMAMNDLVELVERVRKSAGFRPSAERTADASNIKCYQCGEFGHVKRFCRSPAGGAPASSQVHSEGNGSGLRRRPAEQTR